MSADYHQLLTTKCGIELEIYATEIDTFFVRNTGVAITTESLSKLNSFGELNVFHRSHTKGNIIFHMETGTLLKNMLCYPEIGCPNIIPPHTKNVAT